MKPNILIQQYLLGNLDAAGVEQLEELLAADPALRQEYLVAASVDSGMREIAIQQSLEHANGTAQSKDSGEHLLKAGGSWRSDKATLRRSSLGWVVVAVAAVAVASVSLTIWGSRPTTIATIESSENAAWESSLPTEPGSDLVSGTLKLKAGIATIRFRSGAKMVVEAPASFKPISAMRTKLNSGTAVFEIPESAEGFVVETPEGFAVDYGTDFVVWVDERRMKSGFELLSGEIEVHHTASGKSLRLQESGATASVSADAIQTGEMSTKPQAVTVVQEVIRLVANGRCGSVARKNLPKIKPLLPEYLYVKKSYIGDWDMRSFFEFDLQQTPVENLASAKLCLNMVPSDRGNASYLPKINRFAVYGLTNHEKSGWKLGSTWENSPGPEDGILLAKFEVPRSQQRGLFEISSDEMLAFLKDQGQKPVTMVLVRETTRRPGNRGASLTHTFASDQHPESVGPTLEITLSEPGSLLNETEEL